MNPDRIVSDPVVLMGKSVVAGIRITVESLPECISMQLPSPPEGEKR
jgi:uncharacterized protein (DUF433 family)